MNRTAWLALTITLLTCVSLASAEDDKERPEP